MLFRFQAFAILLGLFSLTFSVRATHIVGGEMYYDCLGNDVYRVTLKIYRDASPLTNVNQTGFDNQAAIGVYSSGGVLQFTERIPLRPENIEDLTAYVNNPCNVIELDKNVLWIQKAVYETTMTLPPMPGGYNLVYQRCCRSPIVDNLFNAQNQGGTFIAHVPGAGGCNSMPQFKNEPPLALCRNDNLVFDHGATDADGDSLAYSLCTPFHGGSPMDPIPDPPAPPPHQTINWGAGFSANDPITANPGFSIDPNTGQLTGTPNTLGTFVFGVCVREYRNGNLLSEHIRDYQFIVVECEQLIVAEMEQQLNLDQYLTLPPGGNPECSGRTINFQNNTANANQLKFFWNFGDPATDQDTSSAIAPTYTYLADGTYTVMLVVNPGLDCADTTTLEFTVQLPPEVYFTQPDAQCLNNNRFEFKAEGSFTPAAGIAWDFSSNATPATSIAVNPTGITFDSVGQFPVSLTVIEDACLVVYTDTVSIFPHPKANIALTAVKGCAPLTATLESQSFAWTAQQLFWEFGDGTSGTGQSPTHVYDTPGSYDVT
ncbi:MAG: PKD domain-containing protein, partial [Bacteroidota bacterium]